MTSLSDKTLLEIQAVCQKLNVKELHLFGSRVGGSLNDSSDYDFVLSFPENMDLEDYTENFFKLHYELREILGQEVDIVTERSMTNPYFIDEVNKTKVLIYEKGASQIFA